MLKEFFNRPNLTLNLRHQRERLRSYFLGETVDTVAEQPVAKSKSEPKTEVKNSVEKKNKHQVPTFTVMEWVNQVEGALATLRQNNQNSILTNEKLYALINSNDITVINLNDDISGYQYSSKSEFQEKYGLDEDTYYNLDKINSVIRFFAERSEQDLLAFFNNKEVLDLFKGYIESQIRKQSGLKNYSLKNRDELFTIVNNPDKKSNETLLDIEIQALESYLRNHNFSTNSVTQAQVETAIQMLNSCTFFGVDEFSAFLKLKNLNNKLLNPETSDENEGNVAKLIEDMKSLFLQDNAVVSFANLWKRLTGAQLDLDKLINVNDQEIESIKKMIENILKQMNEHVDFLKKARFYLEMREKQVLLTEDSMEQFNKYKFHIEASYLNSYFGDGHSLIRSYNSDTIDGSRKITLTMIDSLLFIIKRLNELK